MSNLDKHIIIKCPKCGAEYLPQEIYIPSDFLPKFDDLVKDDEGKILAIHESPINVDEEYTCDYCNHRFKIHADIKFTAEESINHDFNFEVYESPLYAGDRVKLNEND